MLVFQHEDHLVGKARQGPYIPEDTGSTCWLCYVSTYGILSTDSQLQKKVSGTYGAKSCQGGGLTPHPPSSAPMQACKTPPSRVTM